MTKRGVVRSLKIEKGYGFLGAPGEADTFFHMGDLKDLPFNNSLTGAHIEYEVRETARGPRAVNVRAAG